jgi:hypothetical protein
VSDWNLDPRSVGVDQRTDHPNPTHSPRNLRQPHMGAVVRYSQGLQRI